MASNGLLPGVEQIYGNTGRSTPYRLTSVPWKIILHTVEGRSSTLEGWRSVARNHANGPHLWVDPLSSRRWRLQTVPLNMSAKALAHPRGTMETNHARAAQVEIAGFASQTQTWERDDLEWIGSDVVAPMVRIIRELGGNIDLKVVERTYGANEGIVLATVYSPIRYAAPYWVNTLNWVSTHQRVHSNCVTPDTPILCADLVWRPAGDLLVGDEIIAFDENPDSRGNRKFNTATVTVNAVLPKESVRVVTDKGEVVTTTDHPWLARIPAGPKWPGKTKWGWVEAKDLTAESEVSFFTEPWEVDLSWSSGWLAGMFDADGSLCRSARTDKGIFYNLAIGQRESLTQQRVEMELLERGFDVKSVAREPRSSGFISRQTFHDIRIGGGRAEIMRALGSIRPQRLLDHQHPIWEGSVNRSTTRARVLRVESVGVVDVASMETSSATFIANGFLMHNSHWDAGRLDLAVILAAAREELNETPAPVPVPDPEEITVSQAAEIMKAIADLKAFTDTKVLSLMSFIMENQKTAVLWRVEGTTAPWYGRDGDGTYMLDRETAIEFKTLHEIKTNSATISQSLHDAITSIAPVVNVTGRSAEDIAESVSATDAEHLNGHEDH